jgi:hypothetical protein
MKDLLGLASSAYKNHGLNDVSIERLAGVLSTKKHRSSAIAFAAEILLGLALRRSRGRILRAAAQRESVAVGGGGAPTTEDVDLITGKTAGDWPVWGDLKLRAATYEEVEDQYNRLSKHADGTLRHMRFLRRVLDRLSPGEIVGERLSDEELDELLTGEQREEGAA